MWGRKFGYLSFFIPLVEEDVDGADEEGEDGSGDGVFARLGEGGSVQELLHAEHGGQADAEGEGDTGHDAGDGVMEECVWFHHQNSGFCQFPGGKL